MTEVETRDGPGTDPGFCLEHRYAQVNGVRLHYVTAGEGPLMLFVHGFPEFWFEWRHQLAEFARDYEVVAVDLRGFNLSDKPAEVGDYRISLVAEDLRQLIRALGREKAIVVAHDWGGSAAWYLASRHPEVIDRLVIVNAPHPATFARELAASAEQRAASDYIRQMVTTPGIEDELRANNYQRMIDTFARRAPEGAQLDEPTLDRYREAWSQPRAIDASLNYYRASPLSPGRNADVAQRKPEAKVHASTLVIWGMSDVALRPGLIEGLEEHVPHLEIVRIPEGTHWVVQEFPDRVNGAIREYLGR